MVFLLSGARDEDQRIRGVDEYGSQWTCRRSHYPEVARSSRLSTALASQFTHSGLAPSALSACPHHSTTGSLAANGTVYARWPSLGSATVAETVFNVVGSVPELNLLNPDPAAENQNRPIFGVSIRHQSASATLPPIVISYSISQRPASSPMPTSLPVLTGDDAIIRQGLIAFGLAIRDDCWPELGPAGPPAPPPTLNDRSFYRLKSLAALHDANGNHFPDELEGYSSNLMISEVCYASLTAVDAHQPHEFPPAEPGSDPRPAFLNRPPDWVEILNPTGQAISTGNYCLSDKNTNLGRSRLPAVSIPAYGTLILLLSDSPHPLFETEGDPISIVRKCWIPWRLKDEGEPVYLSQDNTPAVTTDALTLVDTLTPPQIGTTALTGYTVGKVPRADHTWQAVFLPASSVNQVNQGWSLTRILSAPVVTEVPAAGGSGSPARSRLFRRAADLPRLVLSHPEPDAVITYTLDGTEPGADDGIYEGPLKFTVPPCSVSAPLLPTPFLLPRSPGPTSPAKASSRSSLHPACPCKSRMAWTASIPPLLPPGGTPCRLHAPVILPPKRSSINWKPARPSSSPSALKAEPTIPREDRPTRKPPVPSNGRTPPALATTGRKTSSSRKPAAILYNFPVGCLCHKVKH